MNKKKLMVLASVGLTALLISLVGASAVFAQEPTPDTEAPFAFGKMMRGRRPTLGGAHFFGGQWTIFDTAAEVLGLTPEELFSELHAGQTLAEVAEAQGVEMEALREAFDAARNTAMQEAIERAVENGAMSEEQADWILEGIEKGFMPRGRRFGPGPRLGDCPNFAPDASSNGEDL